jgi:hypothetical protein
LAAGDILDGGLGMTDVLPSADAKLYQAPDKALPRHQSGG